MKKRSEFEGSGEKQEILKGQCTGVKKRYSVYFKRVFYQGFVKFATIYECIFAGINLSLHRGGEGSQGIFLQIHFVYKCRILACNMVYGCDIIYEARMRSPLSSSSRLPQREAGTPFFVLLILFSTFFFTRFLVESPRCKHLYHDFQE